MEKLSATHGETVNLGIKDGSQVVYLDKCESTHLLRAELAVGTRIPMHCTALGKAILAFRPENERKAFCGTGGLKAYTDRTITSPKALALELAGIRQQGFAVDDEEHFLGRARGGPAGGLPGFAHYALRIAAPESRLSPGRLTEIGVDLKRTCERISGTLGEIRT